MSTWLSLEEVSCATRSGKLCVGPLDAAVVVPAVLVVGPNGCGKSVLGRLVTGLSPASYDGLRIGGAARLAYGSTHPHDPLLFSYFPQAWDLLFLGSAVRTDLELLARRVNISIPRLMDGIVRMGVEPAEVEHRPPTTLSRGERQRVGLGVLWGMSPKAAFLDEPDAFLDESGIECLRRCTGSAIDQGIKLLVATHDQSLYPTWPVLSLPLVEQGAIDLPTGGGGNPPSMQSSPTAAHRMRSRPVDFGRFAAPVKLMLGPRRYLFVSSVPVRPGGLTALHGANGTGKTTLLRWICRTVMSTNSRVRSGSPAVVYVTDDSNDQLAWRDMDLEFRLNQVAPDALSPVQGRALRRLGGLKAKITTLSWGGRRLAATLLAVARKPALLLVDEPIAGLDDTCVQLVLELLDEALTEGAAVIVTMNRQGPLWRRADHRCALLRTSDTAIEGGPAAA